MANPSVMPRLYTPSVLEATQVMVLGMHGYIPMAARKVAVYLAAGGASVSRMANPTTPSGDTNIAKIPRCLILSATYPIRTVMMAAAAYGGTDINWAVVPL